MAANSVKNELPVDRAVDRPTVTFDRWQLLVDRAVDRTQIQRAAALCTVGRSVDRVQPESNLLGLWVSQRARIRARRSTATVDRLLGTVDRPSLAEPVQVQKNM